VTILLIVGAGLAGTSEVTKNKLVAYPGFAVGGVGIIIIAIVHTYRNNCVIINCSHCQFYGISDV
jgi:hypothetical protein